MAKIYREKRKNGAYAILNVDVDGKRRKLGLGYNFAKSNDVRLLSLINDLENLKFTGAPLDSQTVERLSLLSDEFQEKLAGIGLISIRVVPLLDEFLDQYGKNQIHWADSTRRKFESTKSTLVEFFGAKRQLKDISEGDVEDFRQHLIKKDRSKSTISRTIRNGRQYFTYATKKEFIRVNPFKDAKAGGETNRNRIHFVTQDDIQKCVDAAPSAEWKALIMLWRIGGLRANEALLLTWDDIYWDINRIRVHSPKTKHFGKGERVIPLYPELLPFLERLFAEAPEGSTRLIRTYKPGRNLGTQFGRIVEKAGLKKWPRLLNNLRASRQKEIAEEFGIIQATEWMGNTESVAREHYLAVSDADYEKAITPSGRIVGQQDAEHSRTEHEKEKAQKEKTTMQQHAAIFPSVQIDQVGRAGLEPATKGL